MIIMAIFYFMLHKTDVIVRPDPVSSNPVRNICLYNLESAHSLVER